MEKRAIIIALIVVIALTALVAYMIFSGPRQSPSSGAISLSEVGVSTQNSEYEKGGAVRVNITNQLSESVCFSSCYPYYLEKRNGGWEKYGYADCPEKNIVEKCVSPQGVKGFELTLPSVEGMHRIAVPACVGCGLQELFRQDGWAYSNEFMVK